MSCGIRAAPVGSADRGRGGGYARPWLTRVFAMLERRAARHTDRIVTRTELEIHIRLSASDGRAVALAGRLVRSGGAATELAGETPFEATVTLPPPPAGGCLFVRLEVTRPHALLARPVFVRSPA